MKVRDVDTTKMNIYQKLFKIIEVIGAMKKTKNGYSFKYVPEEEIQAKLTGGMQIYGLSLTFEIIPNTLKVTPALIDKFDKKLDKNITNTEMVVTADTIYRWINVDNPSEFLEVPWVLVGQMADASQAFGAGTTYCNRYFLMKTLQLATTEDDPDTYKGKRDKMKKDTDVSNIKTAISEISRLGSLLVANGIGKDLLTSIVAKYNKGNPDHNSISKMSVAEFIINDFCARLDSDDSKE